MSKDEVKKYTGKKLSDSEIYTLLANDLLPREYNLRGIIGEECYNSLPTHIKESLMLYIFNKGENSIDDKILNALHKKDYTTVCASFDEDYSILKDKNGKEVKVYSSGLAKRRLFEIANASKIFRDNIPEKILKKAKKIYENGLYIMSKEVKEGKISKDAYPNIKAEYKDLAYKWFHGKIGKKWDERAEMEARRNNTNKLSAKQQEIKQPEDLTKNLQTFKK